MTILDYQTPPSLLSQYRWFLYAFLSALSASFIGIFAKIGMAKVDSNLATGVRSLVMTLILLTFCASMGLWSKVGTIDGRALLAIVLSGLAGAISWLFYFKAIQVGTVSQVAPVDKLSMPLAIILAVIILKDRPTGTNWLGILLIAGGAYLASWPRK